jgi:predicted ATP-dependent endonuclease of OLD family
LRQASESDETLGFQIAPGVAEVAAAKCNGLTAEAGRVVFLVDGDDGGLRNEKKLREGGIAPDEIVVLVEAAGDTGGVTVPLEMEDLIDADIYIAAINAELSFWNDSPSQVTASDLGTSLRTKALEAWCIANGLTLPDKVAVAERVLDLSTARTVFEAGRQQLLQKLRTDLIVRLGIT